MSDPGNPRIEVWPIDRVAPYEKNPRSLPDKAVAKVAASLKAFGFQKPIVVKRWQEFTGQKATLEATGQTFEQVDDERYAKTGASDNSARSYDAAIAKIREQHEAAA